MSNKFQNEDFKSETELTTAGGTKAQLLNTTKIYSPKSDDVLETLLRKNNFGASIAPSLNDDSSLGYQTGSVWIDTANEKSYNCISNTVGAAIWKEGGGGVATANGLTAIIDILNNQLAFVNSGIVFTYPTIKSFEIFAQITRTTTTNAANEVTKLLGVYDIANSKWTLTDTGLGLSGVTFDITAIGELQYKSTDLTGATYVGEMAYSYQANGGAISGTNPNDLGSDGLNYVKGNAENGTNGWATYADAAAARPVDGTGGVANITFLSSGVTPLRGLKSFIFTKDAVNRQGQGVGYNFTIDIASKAKVLTIDFDYLVNSGTFVAGTNTTDGDLICSIYDVTNNVIIEPSSIKLLGNSSTIAGKFAATFQTAHNSVSYRLMFHVASVSALAYSLKIDNISVAPSQYVYGTPITDWFAFTPVVGPMTGFTVNLGWWRRVGSNMEVRYDLLKNGVAGTGATAISFTLPSSAQIDTAKTAYGSPTTVKAGSALLYNTGVASFDDEVPVYIQGATSFGLIKPGTGTALIGTEMLAGGSISIFVSVPILGWSSSVQMSDSADTRVVVLEALTTGVPTGTPPSNSSQTTLIFGSVNADTHGGYNLTTGVYTIPVSGFYDIKGATAFTGSFSNNGVIDLYIVVNGVPKRVNRSINSSSNGQTLANISSGVMKLNAGDLVRIDVIMSNWTSFTVSNSNQYHIFSVQRVTGPSAIAANENIICRVQQSSGQSLGASGSATIIVWDAIKTVDTHGAMDATTGIFIAPISGLYEVSAAFLLGNTSYSQNSEVNLYILRNNIQYSVLHDFVALVAGSFYGAVSGSDIIKLNAGDTLKLQIVQSSGSVKSLYPSTVYNHCTIKRVGN